MSGPLPFSSEVDPITNPKRQLNADGSVEFACMECGAYVFCAVDDGFELPVCKECRWFGERPQIKRPAGA